MLTATICLRADTLPDFNSVLDIIKKAGLPVSIEEVVIHEKSGPYFGGSVKAPSIDELKVMIEETFKGPIGEDKLLYHYPSNEELLGELRGGEEEHF